MAKIIKLRKSRAGNYSVGLPREIGLILEQNNISDLRCTMNEKNEILLRDVRR